jgi:hypothetical protein
MTALRLVALAAVLVVEDPELASVWPGEEQTSVGLI